MLHPDAPISATTKVKIQSHPGERWTVSCCALNKRDGRSLTFHFAAERDLRLSFNDALTKLSGHLLGIVTVQIQLVSNLFVREIQPHKIEAKHPDAQRLVVTGKDRPGEVVEPLPTDGALILLSFRLGFVV